MALGFRVASHGGSFHAPQEIQRILSHGLDRAMQARLAVSKVLAKNGYTGDVPMPDISTKAKAQEYIGLDMDAERAAKEIPENNCSGMVGEKRKKTAVWHRNKRIYICGANHGVIKKGW